MLLLVLFQLTLKPNFGHDDVHIAKSGFIGGGGVGGGVGGGLGKKWPVAPAGSGRVFRSHK